MNMIIENQIDIQSAKEALKKVLSKVKGVNGIGVAYDSSSKGTLIVNITSDFREDEESCIPDEIGKYKVLLQKIDEIVFQN